MLIDDRPGCDCASLFIAGRQFKDACLFSPVVAGALQLGRFIERLHARSCGCVVALLMTLVFNVPSQKWTLSPRFCPTLSTL